MSEKRFIVFPNNVVWDNQLGEVVCRCILEGIGDAENVCQRLNELHEESDVLKQQLQTKYVVNEQYEEIQRLKKENEDLREVNKENQLLHEENVKQCEKWKNLYELKDSEVTARVDTLNRVCNYYLTEVQFKGYTNPNDAVKEVINEILNTPIYEE